ncbi:hypothetical protein JCM10207_006280 [Rhodosporidiobolus poonsookiae]
MGWSGPWELREKLALVATVQEGLRSWLSPATQLWLRAELAVIDRILTSVKGKAACAASRRWAGEQDVQTDVEEASEPEYRDLGKFKEAAFRERIEQRFGQLRLREDALELLYSDEFCAHPLVDDPTPLDDQTWKRIEKPLRQHLGVLELAHDRKYRETTLWNSFKMHLRNKDPAAPSGLYPLPTWGEFRLLKAVKPLWLTKTAGDLDRPYIDLFASERTDLRKAAAKELEQSRALVKQEVFQKVMHGLRQREAQSGKKRRASSLSVASPVLLPPKPAQGGAFSAAEIDRLLQSPLFYVGCQTCHRVDTLPQLMGHHCALSTSDVEGIKKVEKPCLRAASYRVDDSILKTVSDVVGVAKLGLCNTSILTVLTTAWVPPSWCTRVVKPSSNEFSSTI